MAKNQESINRSLFELLRSRGYAPTLLDTSGKEIPVPEEAEVFQFKFTKDGEEYGTVTASIDGLHKLIMYFGDDVANSEKEDNGGDDSWYKLLNHLKRFAQQHQLSFEVKNRDHLKYDMAKREHMKKQERISEGYYPMGKKASYNDNIPTVKIVIEHSRTIEEGEQRYRNVNRIFLENTQGERILAPTTKPGVAQVYARHLAEGGLPHDDRWNHIVGLCEEYNKMGAFVRATRNNQFNESAQQLVNEGISHYQSLRESLSKMRGSRGYNTYFESYTPPLMEDETEENNLNELFVQETLDPRIESVMPILSKLHKKVAEMKEVNELSEWADSLTEVALEEGDGGQAALNPAGIPEGKGPLGQGDLGLALKSLGGSWSSWHEENSHDPDIEVYEYDDGEGGYYASGSIEHNLKTGEIKVHYQDGENNVDVDDTFHSIGDAMKALRGGNSYPSWGGKKPNFDTLGGRELAGPDDLYKTDKKGKKGTLGKARMDTMKASSPYRMRGGPKGVLPEEDLDEQKFPDNSNSTAQRSKVVANVSDLINDPRLAYEPKRDGPDNPRLKMATKVMPTINKNKPEFGKKRNPNDPSTVKPSVFGPYGVEEGILDTVKKGVKAVDKFVTGGDKEDLIKKLQKDAGLEQTGKKPEPKPTDKPVGEGLDDAQQADQKINTPAVHRKEQGGDWKVTTQDLAKADEKNMTSPAGMAALKKRMNTIEEDEVDESALQASFGIKKYGEKGMDALRKAGKKHASEKKMQNIRAEFSDKEKPVTEDGEFAGDYATGEAGQWRNKGPKANKPATIGDLVGEGEENKLDPWKNVNPRVDNPKIKGTDKRAKSAYYPEPKPPVKKLDTPLTNETVAEGSDDLARILNIAGIRK